MSLISFDMWSTVTHYGFLCIKKKRKSPKLSNRVCVCVKTFSSFPRGIIGRRQTNKKNFSARIFPHNYHIFHPSFLFIPQPCVCVCVCVIFHKTINHIQVNNKYNHLVEKHFSRCRTNQNKWIIFQLINGKMENGIFHPPLFKMKKVTSPVTYYLVNKQEPPLIFPFKRKVFHFRGEGVGCFSFCCGFLWGWKKSVRNLRSYKAPSLNRSFGV